MDEAVWRFHAMQRSKGLIINLDVDCTCDSNYLKAIHKAYRENDDFTGGVVHFEHPLSADNVELTSWIIDYELHLRYYIDVLRFINYPYAFQTIGSTMVTTLEAYQKQGGMNQRKAGEDFYYLHKMFPLGGFYRIHGTTVYPEARLSSRVPFGTGKALLDMQANPTEKFCSYNPQSFEDLSALFGKVHSTRLGDITVDGLLGDLPVSINNYLHVLQFEKNIARIKKHSASYRQFVKSFYNWFSGLKILQFMHYCRDKHYPDIPIEKGVSWLLQKHMNIDTKGKSKRELLMDLRNWDKEHD
jgi:hypothetical protein